MIKLQQDTYHTEKRTYKIGSDEKLCLGNVLKR